MKEGLRAATLIMEEVRKVIIGKDDIIRKVMISILANGHILIEDIPGVGKTTLAMAFSKAMKLEHNRIQFTPDVMPSDVTGFSVYNKDTNQFEYRKGAVMCNLLLADEINRTSSKTQSALLEAMEERRITVDGETRALQDPFIVIATQNPIGSIGTQMLPESQMDRFIMKITMGYPSIESEIEMLKDKHMKNPMDSVNPILNSTGICAMQMDVERVFIHDEVYAYIAEIAAATRRHPALKLGISPRGSIAVSKAAKAEAYLNGRDYVLPEDVRAILEDTVKHRLILSSKARINHITIEQVLEDIVKKIVVEKGIGYAEK